MIQTLTSKTGVLVEFSKHVLGDTFQSAMMSRLVDTFFTTLSKANKCVN